MWMTNPVIAEVSTKESIAPGAHGHGYFLMHGRFDMGWQRNCEFLSFFHTAWWDRDLNDASSQGSFKDVSFWQSCRCCDLHNSGRSRQRHFRWARQTLRKTHSHVILFVSPCRDAFVLLRAHHDCLTVRTERLAATKVRLFSHLPRTNTTTNSERENAFTLVLSSAESCP